MRTGILNALKYAERALIRGSRRNALAAVRENRRWAADRSGKDGGHEPAPPLD